MNWFATAFGAHYPVLYAHRDEAEARRAVAAFAALAAPGPGRVLDLGCGAGRHLGPLTGRGWTAVGLDLSAALLAAATAGAAVRPAPLVRGDMRRLPLRGGACARVLSLINAFGYFGDMPHHQPVVAEVGRVLAGQGRWFLDYLNCAAVRAELDGGPRTREREAGPLRVTERRRLAGERVEKEVLLRPAPGAEEQAAALGVPAAGLSYVETVALFDIDALDVLAAAHGLRRAAAGGGYGGEAFGAASPRWLLVYAKDAGDEEEA